MKFTLDGRTLELQDRTEKAEVVDLQSGDKIALEQSDRSNLELLIRDSRQLVVDSHEQLPDLITSLFPPGRLASAASIIDRTNRGIFIDTTTLTSAESCIARAPDKSYNPTPIGLLNLSLLCFASTLYDTIYVLDTTDTRAAARSATDLPVKLLEIDYKFRNGPLYELWSEARAPFTDNHDVQEKFEGIWNALFPIFGGQIKLDMTAYNQYQNSPPQWNGEVASYFGIGCLAEYGGDKVEIGALSKLLSIETLRTAFNDRFANYLGIPYITSSHRTAAYQEILRARVYFGDIADKLIGVGMGRIEEAGKEPIMQQFSMPLMLGIVTSRAIEMSKANGKHPIFNFWAALSALRKDLEPLRRDILESEAVWDGSHRRYIVSRFGKYLDTGLIEQFIGKTREVSGAAITIAGAAVGGGVGTAVARTVAPLIEKFGSNSLKKTYLRLFKPHVFTLFKLREESQALLNAYHVLNVVWNKSVPRSFLMQLEFLAQSSPWNFSSILPV